MTESVANLDWRCRFRAKKNSEETIRYFVNQIDAAGVNLKLDTEATFEMLLKYDEVVMAAGVEPRKLNLEGIDQEKVVDYQTLIREKTPVGEKVAIVGAGGIGIDGNHAHRANFSWLR